MKCKELYKTQSKNLVKKEKLDNFNFVLYVANCNGIMWKLTTVQQKEVMFKENNYIKVQVNSIFYRAKSFTV